MFKLLSPEPLHDPIASPAAAVNVRVWPSAKSRVQPTFGQTATAAAGTHGPAHRPGRTCRTTGRNPRRRPRPGAHRRVLRPARRGPDRKRRTGGRSGAVSSVRRNSKGKTHKQNGGHLTGWASESGVEARGVRGVVGLAVDAAARGEDVALDARVARSLRSHERARPREPDPVPVWTMPL